MIFKKSSLKSRFYSLCGGLVINGGETATVSTASL